MRGKAKVKQAKPKALPKNEHLTQTKLSLILSCLMLIMTILGLVALTKLAMSDSPNLQTGSVITITGTPTCLPHRNTGGPTTTECALGLRGDDGRYYGLIDAPPSLWQQFDTHIRIKGSLSAPEPTTIYAVAGTISVQTVTAE